MSRGGTLHVERGYTSRREGVLFTSREGTLHVERGYSSRRELSKQLLHSRSPCENDFSEGRNSKALLNCTFKIT